MIQCQLVISTPRRHQIDPQSLRKQDGLLDFILGNKHSGLSLSFPLLIFAHIALLFIASWECTTLPQTSLGNERRYWGCSVLGGDVPWVPSLMMHWKMLVNCFNPYVCPRFKIHCLVKNSSWEEDMTRNSVWETDVWENMWLLGKRDLLLEKGRNESRFIMISREGLHFTGNHQWKSKRNPVVVCVQQRECKLWCLNSSINLSFLVVEQ